MQFQACSVPCFEGLSTARERGVCMRCQSLSFLLVHVEQLDVLPAPLVQALLLSLTSAFFLLVTAYNEGRSALPLLSLPFALTLDGQLTCQESS